MKNKDVIVTVTGACGHTWKSNHAAILAGTWDVCPKCEKPSKKGGQGE